MITLELYDIANTLIDSREIADSSNWNLEALDQVNAKLAEDPGLRIYGTLIKSNGAKIGEIKSDFIRRMELPRNPVDADD